MKHKNELDFFEKIYIRKKAKHDVLNKCFRYILFNDDMNQLVKYDEVSTVPINVKQRVNFMIRLIRSLRKIMGEFHSDKINSYDQICLNDEKGTEETYFVVSQFIMTEIVKFIAKRDYILSNSYIIVFFPGDKRKRIRIKRVAKAVTLIESEINKLKKCKEDTERQFNSEFYELETKMNVSQEKKYAHKVSLYRSLMIKNQEKNKTK